MIASPPMDELAELMRKRADASGSWEGPYILFLGKRCAQAAGAPSDAEIAREALQKFGFASNIPLQSLSEEELIDQFAQHTEKLSSSQLMRMLQSIYARVPVPSFYQDLALIIRERYFPLILTTNFDTLLEQALAAAGVRNSEYRVTTIAARQRSSVSTESANQPPLTHIVKLHGDLATNTAHISFDEIENALNASRRWIKAELKGDLVMVGHVAADDPIDRWLAHSSQRQLWWVDELPPDDPQRVQAWTIEYHEITGDEARPQIFFSQLALRLLRAPESMVETVASFAGLDVAETIDGSPFVQETTQETQLADFLQREIRRNQSILYNLEQDVVPGERPSKIQNQIEYQKRQISKLEEKIRSLPEIKPHVIDLVNRICADIQRAHDDPQLQIHLDNELVQYVNLQKITIENEISKDEPNQFLVSASLGATLTLADRLVTEFGSQVIDPNDVRQLAALAPTAAAKMVLQ